MSIMKDVVRDGDEITAVVYTGTSKSESSIVFRYVSMFLKNAGCMPIEVSGADRLLKVKKVTFDNSEERFKITVNGTLMPGDSKVYLIMGRANGRTASLELIKNMKLKGEYMDQHLYYEDHDKRPKPIDFKKRGDRPNVVYEAEGRPYLSVIDKTAPNFYDIVEVHTDVMVRVIDRENALNISWTRDPDVMNFWNDVAGITDSKLELNVTIQILKNSITGAGSVGWTRDESIIAAWVENAHTVTYA